MAPQASGFLVIAMTVLPLGVLAAAVAAVARVTGRAGLPVALGLAWLALTGGLAASGVLARFDARPPPMVFVLVPVVGGAIALGLSRVGARLATLPLWLLVGFHGFRFPLELVMNVAAAEGTMPVQMSFAGLNFDIVSGLGALVVGGLAWRGLAPRGLIVAWNAIATALLITIVSIAVASLPNFRAFGDEPARLNTWVAYAPFVWLPTVLAASALLGHVVLWRRLLGRVPGGDDR